MSSILYAPITKTEETPDGLIVEGIASTESVDTQGEVVDYDSLKVVLPDYVQWSNIREMHQPSAVGKALVVTPDDKSRTLLLRALIVDDSAQKKVRTDVYKGFSIGGKARREVQKRSDGSTYTRAYMQLLSEISLADRPSNPDARFTLVKVEDSMSKEETEQQPPASGLSAEQVAALQKLAGNLAAVVKAAADPSKIVAMIQAARNELELAGDMEGAALYTQAIALVQQAAGEAEGSAQEEANEPPAEAQAEGDQPMLAAAKATLKKQYPNLSDLGIDELLKAGVVPTRAIAIRKAGRALSSANLAAMENTVKTLLQMMASAGSEKAQKAIAAMADDTGGGDVAMVAKTIGGEVEKALAPLAAGILAINDRLITVERQPVPGGPMLRGVEKIITGQQPAQGQKPLMPGIIKTQLDDLLRKANTDPNPTLRQQYRQQHDALRAEYQ